jgi:hypothetical protein
MEFIIKSSQIPHPDVIALALRQPWAECILQGIKTLEIRTQPTNLRGTIALYVGKIIAPQDFAKNALTQTGVTREDLILQKIVGTVDIIGCRLCTPADEKQSCVPWKLMQGKYAWELAHPKRLRHALDVDHYPYGVWFYPWRPQT